MKKFLVIALSAMLIFSMTGCGQQNEAPNEVSNEAQNEAVDQEKPMDDGVQFIEASDPSKNPEVAKNRKDTVVIGTEAPDGNFMAYYASSMNDVYIAESILDGLVDIDENGDPAPGIAESWDVSSDGLTYTFNLRDDVKFSDGTPLTAEDVEFTYTFLSDGSFTGVYDVSLIGIKGWKDYNEGKSDKVEGIEVVDEHTVTFTLEEPNSSMVYLVSGPVLSKAYYGEGYKQGYTKNVEALIQKPMGVGPYKLEEFIPGQEVRLTANEHYYRGAPKVKNLIFKATTADNSMQLLLSGEVDIDTVGSTPEKIDQIKDAGFLDMTLHPKGGYNYAGFNTKDPKFSDKRVRQALTYGLDREKILQAVLKGQGYIINQPPTTLPAANEYKYDVDKANQLLDEAGWEKGDDGIREKDGQKFEIRLVSSSPSDTYDLILPIMKDNYEKLGIKLIPETMDFSSVIKVMLSRDFDMYLMGTSSSADVFSDFTGMFASTSAYNHQQYENPELDKLIADGLKETDEGKREEIIEEMFEIVNDELPVLFMFRKQEAWVCNTRVKGPEFRPFRHYPLTLYKIEIVE